MLKLTNTLTGQKEEFKSITPDKVTMYNCGPTVYDYAHIGNLRAYVFVDILRRALELNGYTVNQIINITDIGHLSSDADEGEDKMTKGLKREGKPFTLEAMKELGDMYTEKFKDDLKTLNIQFPEHFPKASDHIKEDIELIKTLESKGFTYSTSDGVYFNTSKFPDYGKLGNIHHDQSEDKTRIGINTEKKNQKDFALWKFNPALGFDTPWGKGFPGWHIECSAMSTKYLGQPFDIHTGGVDHIPVHHNNEIAQSEAATGSPYAHYWIHNEHILMDNGKMAKSEGNMLRLQTLVDKNINPLSYRYWLLTGRYSTKMNFTWDAVTNAQNGYTKLLETVSSLPDGGIVDDNYHALFKGFINDDLDTPKAVALMWELLKDEEITEANKKATILDFDKVLGLHLGIQKEIEIPEQIQTLLKKREEARKNKDFKKSDELREEIKKHGFEVKDTEHGQKVLPLS